jgi:hypothetical protein
MLREIRLMGRRSVDGGDVESKQGWAVGARRRASIVIQPAGPRLSESWPKRVALAQNIALAWAALSAQRATSLQLDGLGDSDEKSRSYEVGIGQEAVFGT